MADRFARETRSRIMSTIRKKDTKPEITVRRELHRRGLRYGLHNNNLSGTPDIVLSKYNIIVQVRGCFWHQHHCRLGKPPRSNRDYWIPKLKRNKERDRKGDAALRREGWHVYTIWECQTQEPKRLKARIDTICRRLQEP